MSELVGVVDFLNLDERQNVETEFSVNPVMVLTRVVIRKSCMLCFSVSKVQPGFDFCFRILKDNVKSLPVTGSSVVYNHHTSEVWLE